MIIEKTHILIIVFIFYLCFVTWILYDVGKDTKEHIKLMEKRNEDTNEQENKK